MTLLFQGKNSTYLKYALGEIILVVIGILMALQINNWNENNKSNQRLKSDLLEVRTELNSDQKRLDSVMNIVDRIDKAGKYLLDYLAEQPKTIDSAKVQEAILSVTILASFGKSNAAYQNLLNNGNYQLVKNKTLKKKLGFFHNTKDWNSAYHDGPLLTSYYEYIRKIHNYVKPGFIRKSYESNWSKKSEPTTQESPFNSTVDFDKLNDGAELISLLDQVQVGRYIQKIYYAIIKKNIEELIQLIDDEIQSIK